MSAHNSPHSPVLATLEHAINKSYASNDVQIHRDIYTLLENNRDQICTLKENVPLSVLAYAIRRIIHPGILPEMIPRLVDLLWTVDAWHRRIVKSASEILVFQDFYKTDKNVGQDLQLLTRSEEASIRDIADDTVSSKLRAAYCTCTFMCCQYNIYDLFAGQDSYLLQARMVQFFPGLREDPERAGRFYCNFSEEEMQALEDEQNDAVGFVKDAFEWEQKRQVEWEKCGQKIDDVSFYGEQYREDFESKFHPPTEPAEIAEFIEAYLKSVEGMFATLQRLFPHKPRASAA